MGISAGAMARKIAVVWAAACALDRLSMANVKLKSFLGPVLQRLLDRDGLDRTLHKCPEALLELGQIEP